MQFCTQLKKYFLSYKFYGHSFKSGEARELQNWFQMQAYKNLSMC